MADRLERLTNLVALLLTARRPLTLEQIAVELAGLYPDDPTNRRQAFERDKRLLREEGVPLSTEVLADPPGATGYRIDPDAYYLPPLELDDDELLALHLAVAAVHLGEASGREALLKLGGLDDDETTPPLVAALPSFDVLPTLYDARRRRAPVSFTYRGERRTVDPYGLLCRHGFWYVSGRDHLRGELRNFRVDRIDRGRVTVGEPGSFDPPSDFDARATLPDDPLLLGGGDVIEAEVVVDGLRAAKAVRDVGADAVRERRDDGSVVLRVPVANRGAFRSWIVGFLDHAVVLGPAELRADIVDWLGAVAGDGRVRS